MTRIPYHTMRIVLDRICHGKQLTLDRAKKDRPETWAAQYREEIDVLTQAVNDYARAEAKEAANG